MCCNNYDRIPVWWNFHNDWTPLCFSIRIVKQPRPRSACYTCRMERFVEKIAYLKPFNYGYAPLISRTVSCSLLLERYELRLYIKLRSAFIVPTLRFFLRSLFLVFLSEMFFPFFNSSVSKIQFNASSIQISMFFFLRDKFHNRLPILVEDILTSRKLRITQNLTYTKKIP